MSLSVVTAVSLRSGTQPAGGHCTEYIAEKAEYERRKEEYYREDRLTGDIVGDRGKKVRNALKGYRKSKIRER